MAFLVLQNFQIYYFMLKMFVGVSVLVPITIYAEMYERVDDVFQPMELGWSFYMSIAGAVFTASTAVLICREGYLLRQEERPYLDL